MTSNKSVKFIHNALKDETLITVFEKTFNDLKNYQLKVVLAFKYNDVQFVRYQT